MKGYVNNIEQATLDNNNFRTVLYTTKQSQLVLMSIAPKDDIGQETHMEHDQFLRIESGTGEVILNGETQTVKDGTAIVVPAGTKHNLINTSSNEPLKLYTLYCPPEHKDGTVHETKADAMSSEEHFDGVTTEQM